MMNVTFTMTCDHCGAKAGYEFDVRMGAETPAYPGLPQGWQEIDGKHVCDRHAVRVIVDPARQEGPQGA